MGSRWKSMKQCFRAYIAKVMRWTREIKEDEWGTEQLQDKAPAEESPKTDRPCKRGQCPCPGACDQEGHCLAHWLDERR